MIKPVYVLTEFSSNKHWHNILLSDVNSEHTQFCLLGTQRNLGIKGVLLEINLSNRKEHLESIGIPLSTTTYMRTININHKNKTEKQLKNQRANHKEC